MAAKKSTKKAGRGTTKVKAPRKASRAAKAAEPKDVKPKQVWANREGREVRVLELTVSRGGAEGALVEPLSGGTRRSKISLARLQGMYTLKREVRS